MRVSQALNFITVMVNSDILSPKVNVELENSTYLRITYRDFQTSTFSRFYKFHKDVLWPGLIYIDRYGIIEVLLFKKEEEIWKSGDNYPINMFYEGRKPVRLPDFYECKVDKAEILTANYKLIRLYIVDRKLYSHIGAGEIVDVKQTVEGKEWIYSFPTVPIMPMINLSYPNPKPGDWHNTRYPIDIIVHRHENRKLNSWLFNRTVGDKVIIGNPRANFSTNLLGGTKYLYLAANEIGLGPMISILLWTLQTTTDTQVYLGIFSNRSDGTFWKKEIEDIQFIDSRLHVTHVSRRNLKAGEIINLRTFKVAFPTINDTGAFFCIAGMQEFVNQIKPLITINMHLPINKIHVFRETIKMFRDDKKEEMPIYYQSGFSFDSSTSLLRYYRNLRKQTKRKVRRRTTVKGQKEEYDDNRAKLDMNPQDFDGEGVDVIKRYSIKKLLNITNEPDERVPDIPLI